MLAGLTVTLVALLAFTEVQGDTSYWLLGGALLLFGMGLGSTTTPAMSAAYQTLQRADVARATTALNIAMRTGGAVGTALLAVILQHQLDDRTGTDALANAFAHTFWWAAGLIVVALATALLLPRRPATDTPR